jgi:PQQ-dependent dehydrogenase (methanol/ethanol family)
MKTVIRAILVAGVVAPALVGAGAAFAQVPYDRIVKAESEPANWLTYAGSYKSQRYTQLDQINKQNVTQLKPAWVYQLRTGGVFETSPVVVDGVMYMTEPPSTVTALDVRTGRALWSWTPKIPDDVIVIGSPPVNRGVAVLDNMVYAGSIAGHLAALDAKSGALRWDVAVDDNKIGYYLTLAPLAIDGKIIVGVSGAENGIRGFVDAYDAKTGKRVWRRHTIPGPGEPGHDTWGGNDSWKTGGGSTWLTGSYDPELKLLYWQTGNPGPDWNGDNRPGDNLYTCSVLALNPDDGTIKWHFQFTPHDTHDWDANETMILFEATVNGRARKLLASSIAPRASSSTARRSSSRRGLTDSMPRAGRSRKRASIRTPKASWFIPASRARPTGTARATARRRIFSTRQPSRWGRFSTRAKRCTKSVLASRPAAGAPSTATMAGARFARWRRPPAS